MSSGVPARPSGHHPAHDLDARHVARPPRPSGPSACRRWSAEWCCRDAVAGQLTGEGLGQADDAPLRRHVVRHVGRTRLGARRRDGHDAAPTGLDHVRHGQLQADERAGQVDGDDAVPLLGCDLGHRVERLDAGTGDHDGDRAERPCAPRRRPARARPGRPRRPRSPRRGTPAPTARRRPPSPLAASRSSSATPCPSAASRRAMPSPMPEAAPVTTATRVAHVATSAGVNSMCRLCRPRRTHVGS